MWSFFEAKERELREKPWFFLPRALQIQDYGKSCGEKAGTAQSSIILEFPISLNQTKPAHASWFFLHTFLVTCTPLGKWISVFLVWAATAKTEQWEVWIFPGECFQCIIAASLCQVLWEIPAGYRPCSGVTGTGHTQESSLGVQKELSWISHLWGWGWPRAPLALLHFYTHCKALGWAAHRFCCLRTE